MCNKGDYFATTFCLYCPFLSRLPYFWIFTGESLFHLTALQIKFPGLGLAFFSRGSLCFYPCAFVEEG